MDDGRSRCRRRRWKIGGAAFWRVTLGSALLFGWLLAGRQAEAQHVVQVPARAIGLLGAEEGRTIVDVALEQVAPLEDARDCSHVVHAIYASAGHAYPYASSAEIYSGDRNFVRVKHPRAGDVIAWWGHVGIVVDPAQHSFYSLVRTGLKAQDYESAYWRSRGQERFYRLRVAGRAAESVGKRTRPVLSADY